MRISAGEWKGRRIEVPAGARPTSSRAREALFDLLGPLRGARVLDLYAGSGAVGLEAISRGAASAVLVERNAAPLSRTLERLGAQPDRPALLLASDATEALRRMAARGEFFDVIFCDPPYGEPPGRGFARLLSRVSAPGARVVFQSDASDPQPEIGGFSVVARRAYGRNVFHFFVASEDRRL